MLTLDPTTLYYLNLSDAYQKDRYSGLKHSTDDLSDWLTNVPLGSRGSLKSVTTPALTKSGRSSNPAANSVRSASAGIRSTSTSNQRPASRSGGLVKVIGETNPNDDESGINVLGGISDNDETIGPERDAAMNSPPKAGRRVNSSVSLYLVIYVVNIITIILVSGKGRAALAQTAGDDEGCYYYEAY